MNKAVGGVIRALLVAVAIAILFLTPMWAETGRGYAVVPVWWPESGATRSLLLSGALIDALAVALGIVAILAPRLLKRS